MQAWLHQLMQMLALPEYGLSTVFVVSFISATLLPMGSEPVVFGLVKLNPELFWPAILVATVGNTLGGAVDWWLGYGAHKVADRYAKSSTHTRALQWLEKLGPKACLLAWLPAVGDPLWTADLRPRLGSPLLSGGYDRGAVRDRSGVQGRGFIGAHAAATLRRRA